MTKLRAAGSFEDAALEAVRILSAPTAAALTGVSPKTIRDYTDADRPGRPSLAVAVKLDAACYAKAGRAPFLEAYTRQLSKLTDGQPQQNGDVLQEALELPGAIGRLLDIVRGTTLPESPKGAALSDNERARILIGIKEPRRELDQLEAAVLAKPER